jgi:lipopolysaccharide cholinephosphotransferase
VTEIATAPGRRLSLEELRERQLRVLDAILEHCEAEGLRVYLCAGTLLGAVRHEGYIAWDDDLDLMLPRPDFERFCRTFGTERPDQISVHSMITSPTFPLPFAKVCDDTTVLDVESDVVRDIGVNVDVFPLDGWLDNTLARRVQRGAISALLQAMRAKHLARERRRGLLRDGVLRAVKVLLAWVSPRQISQALTWVAQRGDAYRSRFIGVTVWGLHEVVPTVAYGIPSTLRFEGRNCPAPADPSVILRIRYGDFMELPPPHKRVTHHRFVGFALETPPPDGAATPE